MDKLDDLAQLTVTDLMMATIDERLSAIVSRTAEYSKLEKDLTTAAERGESAADAIRMQGIQNLIASTTQTIASAKSLAASLDMSDLDEKKLAALINKTIDAVTKLRSGVGGLL
jgi:hypothetical protein